MRVFVIAGEPSGDNLGAAVMAGLKELADGQVSFEGVGGPAMQAEGLQSRFPMSELSVMGLAEILPKYFHLKRRIRECAEAVLADPPDLLLTIDSPDCCLRVARLVKAANPSIRTVHYVAPTVWAWRPKRAVKMAQVIDHVLALFPFEPPLMRDAGMECDFVGHPVTTQPQASLDEILAFRRESGIGDAPIALILPGSRAGEVERLAPIFGQVVERLRELHPELVFVLPVAEGVADLVAEKTRDWPANIVTLDPRHIIPEHFAIGKRAAFAAADVALAASGTVSLELAAANTPMVIAYDMAWLTRVIMKRMLITDTVTLVNLVSDCRVVPEFIGADCRPEKIALSLSSVYEDPGEQYDAMESTMERLGRGGEAPGLRAARAILKRL